MGWFQTWRKPLQPEDIELVSRWRIPEGLSKAVSKTTRSRDTHVERPCDLQSNFAAPQTGLHCGNKMETVLRTHLPSLVPQHSTSEWAAIIPKEQLSPKTFHAVEKSPQNWIERCVYGQLQRGFFCRWRYFSLDVRNILSLGPRKEANSSSAEESAPFPSHPHCRNSG